MMLVSALALLSCAPDVQNAAPVLETSTFADGVTVEIPTVGVIVEVTASDPDGDPMQFRWAIDGIGVQGEDETNVSSTTSSYALAGEHLDGATLSCTITDGLEDTAISWPLVYIGA